MLRRRHAEGFFGGRRFDTREIGVAFREKRLYNGFKSAEGRHNTEEQLMEGTRFDQVYETMPWHKVDTVVFDIGNILICFAPQDFLVRLFPGDEDKQRAMLEQVYRGPYWPEFDRGTIEYEDAARRLCAQFGGAYEDYMHAITGWIELKEPIEEGWRAAERCRRAGKRLLLLSNYHRAAYARLREKFANRFALFDGGCISCDCHFNKPEPEIYETLIKTFDLEPGRTLFIDDTLKNVEGAMRAGIHGFHMDEKGRMDRFFI